MARCRGDTATTTAAFVLLFPLLVVVFMALVQWGLHFHAQSLVTAAAQDAARVAQSLDGTTDDGHSVAEGLLASSIESGMLTDVTIAVTMDDRAVRVEIAGSPRTLVPLPGMERTVRTVVSGPREAFRSGVER